MNISAKEFSAQPLSKEVSLNVNPKVAWDTIFVSDMSFLANWCNFTLVAQITMGSMKWESKIVLWNLAKAKVVIKIESEMQTSP